jgi:hypothetical protein
LPRQLYGIIVGLSVWLIISFWGFIGTGYNAVALSVASLFITIAVGLPLLLALIAHRHPRAAARNDAEPDTLRDWLGSEFEAQTGQLKGAAAATQVLLPIAAVAFGMTIFAVARLIALGA